MNLLYYVMAYNHRSNYWVRFLVSVPNAGDPPQEAINATWPASEKGWSRHSALFICTTEDNVLMEL